jgi:Na+/proline symporter
VNAGSAPKRRLDPILPVVVAVAVGVLFAALHHPRTGMYIVAAALGAGAVLRIVLSPRNAGSLVVRRKRVDVIVLAGLALALFVLAAVTPFPAHSA